MKTNRIVAAALAATVLGTGCAHADPVLDAPVGAERAPHVEETRFVSADRKATYGGTLLVPDGPGPFPAVVLLSVAGPNDRDQTVGTNKGFAELARALADRGVASLRYDDRGVGASSGDYFAASWEDFAADALAAAATVAKDARVDAGRIGFAGMSQGAALAAMACRERAGCAFAVLMSPPALPGETALRGQLETMLAATPMPADRSDQYRALMDEFFAIVKSDRDDRQARMIAFLSGPGAALIPPYRFLPGDPEGLAQVLLGPWYRSNLTFDPARTYAGLRAPVLVVGGGRDPIAEPRTHWPAIRDALDGGTYLELASGNHLLQAAQTGSPTEYAAIDHGIAPTLAEMIAAWAAETAAAP